MDKTVVPPRGGGEGGSHEKKAPTCFSGSGRGGEFATRTWRPRWSPPMPFAKGSPASNHEGRLIYVGVLPSFET